MPTATVLFDTIAWSTEIKGRHDRREYHVARRGDVVDLPEEEYERLRNILGGPAVGSDSELVVVSSRAGEPASWSDEQIASANVEDLVAYLGQHNSEADRVAGIEAQRAKPRVSILKAADRIKTESDAALEDETEQRRALEEAEQVAYENTTGAASAVPRIP